MESRDIMIDQKWFSLAEAAERQIIEQHQRIDQTVFLNQGKVLEAFQAAQISDFHFASSTGYGHNDRGREAIEEVYARTFHTEAALVRPHIVSGTHAIALALFGVLRPGDELLYITGKPYDTLEEVIGIHGEQGAGSLIDFGIAFDYVPLSNGKIDYQGIRSKIKPHTRMIGIQRSSGYELRSSFTVADIAEMIRFVKEISPEIIVMVDNCYGEFTEVNEPTDVGADLVVGSLIKNPGGGLALSGGYIVGRKRWVEQAANRLTAPGIGSEQGAMLGMNRQILQGFFLAPHVVGEALKGAVFAAAMFEKCGFVTHPSWHEPRTDLIQAIEWGSPEALIRFCQSIQAQAPVDSHVRPEPWKMPGYQDPVIMAAGAFVQGSSIELSADGPIRPPYIGFMQGGLTYAHVKWAVLKTLVELEQIGECNVTFIDTH